MRFDIYAVLNIISKRKYKINLQIFDKNDQTISIETGLLHPGLFLDYSR